MKSFFKSLKFLFCVVGVWAVIVASWKFSRLKRVAVASRNVWPGEVVTIENTNIQWHDVGSLDAQKVSEELQRGDRVVCDGFVKSGEVFSTENTGKVIFEMLIPSQTTELVDLQVKINNADFSQFKELAENKILFEATFNSRKSMRFGPATVFHMAIVGPAIDSGLRVIVELPTIQARELSNFVSQVADWRKVSWKFSKVPGAKIGTDTVKTESKSSE